MAGACSIVRWRRDQRLLRNVTGLACADIPEVERARADYIRCHTRGYPYGIPMDLGLAVLEGALAIGRQADPFPAEEVKTRMDTARAQTRMPTSAPDRSFLTIVKDWLKAKETA